MKHTPRPWKVEHLTIKMDHSLSKKMRIAQVFMEGVDLECAKANARLIAAAPELYEACKEACAALYVKKPKTANRLLKEALAKAEKKEAP